ncbi:spore germination protein [Pseudalkalibacillus berkeleyi]|uniref:Spore germination protein n=1 Tax=Pseudalkalibacillus berkeleyi TaxID=1069813 RepID=A0ABS9H473_9BACL|nr:spore germination protein [Pseudalkalibacillus berkeleyi]MCF6138620.1 spore germination protein [Pseudalkalibacillus berkeleyi]
MRSKWRKSYRKSKQTTEPKESESLQELLSPFKNSKDFVQYELTGVTNCTISYIKTIVEPKILSETILEDIKDQQMTSLEEIKNQVSVQNQVITEDADLILQNILSGFIMIQLEESDERVLLIPAVSAETRKVSIPEVEFSVVGPKEAFVESLDTNINLIRKRLPLPELTVEEIVIGKLTKTRVSTIYIEGIANKENINTVKQRLEQIEFDEIIDSSYISQMISDNSHSPFPQLLDTERPDRVAGALAEGKIIILVDGSPHALSGPNTLIEFFSASDDYYLNWVLASALRIIRLFAVLFSVIATPLYVAILTYHHEMIPEDLMATIITSRADIPFPPILEVIILELAIELLREAGARLPIKVGQTIGIVGGIVIGTAAVEAGLTSNVLLIIVALSALASFTTPVYQIANAIRLIRFPFLIGAQWWGLIGVAMVMSIFLCHIIRLQSLGRPFFAPIYPLRISGLKDAFFRFPFNKQTIRPLQTRPEDPVRFNAKRTNEKRDIDE